MAVYKHRPWISRANLPSSPTLRQIRRFLREQRRAEAALQPAAPTGHGLDHSAWGSATATRRMAGCVSLLKILLTNFCVYDCLYCKPAFERCAACRFSVQEVVDLTLSFYRRNYPSRDCSSARGSSGPPITMEQLVEVARLLREAHQFRGYIHLKTIPEASPELIEAAGRHADRLSVNIELPSREALRILAPEKTGSFHQASDGRHSRGRG